MNADVAQMNVPQRVIELEVLDPEARMTLAVRSSALHLRSSAFRSFWPSITPASPTPHGLQRRWAGNNRGRESAPPPPAGGCAAGIPLWRAAAGPRASGYAGC